MRFRVVSVILPLGGSARFFKELGHSFWEVNLICRGLPGQILLLGFVSGCHIWGTLSISPFILTLLNAVSNAMLVSAGISDQRKVIGDLGRRRRRQ